MLKSSPSFKKNGAHLVENKDYTLWGLSALHMQKYFFICVKLWVCKLCN